jgi:hypothetical protein
MSRNAKRENPGGPISLPLDPAFDRLHRRVVNPSHGAPKVLHFDAGRDMTMPARNPRVNVVLEKPLYEAVDHLAKEEGVSLSTAVRDLVKEAIEIREDIDLGRFAEARENTLRRSRSITHKAIWG